MPRPRKLYDAAALAEERGFLEEFPQTLVDSNPWAGLSVPTKEIYELLLSRWEEYLSKYVPNGVPAGQAPDIDRLKHFMKWLAFSIRGVLDEQPTIASLLTCWARFSTYITEILPTQTNVLNIQKEQGTVAPQDRSDLLESIWKEDIHTYPHPRLLVSISAFWILVWCTAARVGTALESNCYRGSNQALRYKDLKIMVVSGSTPQEGTILLCAVQFSWQKGQRENRNSALPELEFKTKLKNLKKGVVLNSRAPTPPFYEPEKLCDNFLLYIFAHALADDAFKTIRSVQDVSNLQPPPGRNALELNWKETALELPVFRMVTPERVTDNALSVGALYTFLHGHQDRFGYMKHVTIHAVRRHAGTVLDGITTEAARMHHMGQKSKPIFSDCYVDNVPHFDLQAAIFSEESHLDDISQLRRLGNYRDTRLPTDLSAEEERKFNQMPEVATLNNEIQTLTAADDIKHNKKLYQHRQELYSKKARLRKAAVDELRQRCFDGDSVYTPLLEANQQLRKETLAVVMKLLPERDRLSRMLFTKAKIRSEAGTQALTDLATLCAQGDHARVLYRPGESPINGHCPICDKAMLE
ncbi:MAG: hypothetical protein M1834_000949 [Cirrosporium novae-zelandiae]|nr:MAG: hypothetical protein M1834_000949 [Cirrosporium novae-zelandiae]